MDDARQGMTLDLLGERVEVGRHHAPGEEAVAFSVEVVQRIFDDLRQSGSSQQPFTEATPQLLGDVILRLSGCC